MTDDQNNHAAMKSAMLAAMVDTDPNIHALIDRGIVRARHIRRKRRTAWAVSSTAVVVLVAGVLATAGRHKTAEPAPGKRIGSVDPASSAGVYDALKALLPAGTKLSGGAFTDINDTVAHGSLGALGGITISELYVYDDGHGLTSLVVNIEDFGPAEYQQSSHGGKCSTHVLPGKKCSFRRLPDGSVVEVDQGPQIPSDPQGPSSWTASLVRPNVTDVSIEEFTAVDSNPGSGPSRHSTRATPPLSVDQLVTIADAPVWAPLGPRMHDSVPTHLGPTAATAVPTPAADARRATPAELATVLKSLIPDGLPASASDPGLNLAVGEGHVLVKDGHGDVRLTVHNGTRAEAPYACGTVSSGSQDSCRDITLADGTVVQLTHFGQQNVPGGGGFGPGVEEWAAVAVHPSGVVVVLEELNTTAPAKPATRKDVPVSLDQLGTIAGDKAWDRFQGESPPPTFGATASPGYVGPGALDPGTPSAPAPTPTPAPSGR